MATFRQAYWYTHECPLRKVNLSVFPEPESAQVIRNHIHTHVLDVFEKNQSNIVKKANGIHLFFCLSIFYINDFRDNWNWSYYSIYTSTCYRWNKSALS